MKCRKWAALPHRQIKVLPLTREWIEILPEDVNSLPEDVLPLTREWIEISVGTQNSKAAKVLPLTREWIEIPRRKPAYIIIIAFSLLRGSGLKWLIGYLC